MANKRLYELTYVTELSGTSSMLIDDPSYSEAGKLTVDDVKNYVLSGITITNVYTSGISFNQMTGDFTLLNSDSEQLVTNLDGKYLNGTLDGTSECVLLDGGGYVTGYTSLKINERNLDIGLSVSFPIYVHTGTTNYNIQDTDFTVICSTSGATVTLPDTTSLSAGRLIVVKSYSSYTKIKAYSGDNIYTDSSVTEVERTSVGQSLIVQTDGNGKWYSWG